MGETRIMARLKDVPEMQPRLQPPKKVLFFAPHTSEHMAVMPVINEVKGHLEGAGIPSESHVFSTMKIVTLAMAIKLNAFDFTDEERVVLQRLYRLRDSVIRLDTIDRLLLDKPDALLVEAHALDNDYQMDDHFPYDGGFYRLPGSRVLVLKDFYAEYSDSIRQGLRAIEPPHPGNIKTVLPFFGIDHLQFKEGIPVMLDILRKNIHRCLLIEVPAPFMDPLPDFKVWTKFEKIYGVRESLRNTLGSDDILALSRALRQAAIA